MVTTMPSFNWSTGLIDSVTYLSSQNNQNTSYLVHIIFIPIVCNSWESFICAFVCVCNFFKLAINLRQKGGRMRVGLEVEMGMGKSCNYIIISKKQNSNKNIGPKIKRRNKVISPITRKKWISWYNINKLYKSYKWNKTKLYKQRKMIILLQNHLKIRSTQIQKI